MVDKTFQEQRTGFAAAGQGVREHAWKEGLLADERP